MTARSEDAGAETVGAIILFGLFITMIAILNANAVPKAGESQEGEHFSRVLDTLGALATDMEAAGSPGADGVTVARVLPMGPERDVGQEFFSYFMAVPAMSVSEVKFEQDYGDVRVTHYRDGSADAIVDVGTASGSLPFGRLTVDPHPVYRPGGIARLELGGVVTTDGDPHTMRVAPPFDVAVSDGVTTVTAKTRILTGTPMSVGGGTLVRVGLTTETTTLTTPAAPNAERVIVRVESAHGDAWVTHFTRVSENAGLAVDEFTVVQDAGAGASGLDVVTWTVLGTGSGNDVRVVTGTAVYTVTLG